MGQVVKRYTTIAHQLSYNFGAVQDNLALDIHPGDGVYLYWPDRGPVTVCNLVSSMSVSFETIARSLINQ